jgi:hypothetical protein
MNIMPGIPVPCIFFVPWTMCPDTSVKDYLSKGLKIQGIGDTSKNVLGYLVEGQFITASSRPDLPD